MGISGGMSKAAAAGEKNICAWKECVYIQVPLKNKTHK
jgi:hypothetical protein